MRHDTAGHAAIGIERRTDDPRAEALLAAIHDAPTGERLAAERAYLATLDGSCQTPIAGLAIHAGEGLWLRGEILRPDGSDVIRGEIRCAIPDAAAIDYELPPSPLARDPLYVTGDVDGALPELPAPTVAAEPIDAPAPATEDAADETTSAVATSEKPPASQDDPVGDAPAESAETRTPIHEPGS